MLNTTLSPDQLRDYEEKGYLREESMLTNGDVEAVGEAFRRMTARALTETDAFAFHPQESDQIAGGARFQRRDGRFFFQLEKDVEPEREDADKLELQVRKFMWFEDEEPVFRRLLAPDGPLLPRVEEILGEKAELFQSLALIKPPRIGSTKPWHQDNAYFSVRPFESVVGVWIAIDEATTRNGCMHMLAGGHRAGPLQHVHDRDCEIPVKKLDLSTLEPVPLPPGGCLFFNGMVPHETPPNRTDQRRRALQFHFRGVSSSIVPTEEYDRLFADADGNPASCDAVRRMGF